LEEASTRRYLRSMPEKKRALISFVVPVYNEEENVDQLYDAVVALMLPMQDAYDFEIIFTDNHSTDTTFEKLESIAREDDRVRVIRFSRNFGYQLSIYTGYINAKGDAAIQLDCDLQDPPELIPEFLRLWREGNKVVYGIRSLRKEGWWIRNVRKAFYRIINFISEDYLPPDAGDFRLVDRCILEELKKVTDNQPYLRGIIASIGFRQIGVPYNRLERVRGESKFALAQLIKLAADGILNHSIFPLRIATWLGIFVSSLTFILSFLYLLGRLFLNQFQWPAGFATTTILILLTLSVLSLFLGIIGEYLGRIYQQLKGRSTVVIEQKIDNNKEDI
jgi:polyisoprenyl-phosphate glycosyltransferase